MKKNNLILFFTLLIISQVFAQQSNKCDYTINSYSWKFDGADVGKQTNVIIHDPLVQAAVNQGDSLALKGGDVICLDASVNYSYLNFQNIVGDSINPIIITNVGGQVKIKNTIKTVGYGWKFKKSSNFKILGNGDANHKYGFKITTHKNSFLQLIDKTTDFEVAHVEIAGDVVAQAQENESSSNPENLLGFAGIMAKSQPVCIDDAPGKLTDRGNFEMKNVFIHDNFIHDVSGEGMYIGYGYARQNIFVKSWKNSYRDTINNKYIAVKCTESNVPHDVSNLHVYNNIVESVGWDGIQVKNSYKDTYVYNNFIKDYATLGIGPHDEGLFVGDGSVATIYGNWIENGTSQSNGIQINATGGTKVFNNVVLGSGYTGLYLNNNNYLHLAGVMEIYNNTLEGGTGNAITSYSLNQVVKIKNNIGFGFGTKDTLNDPYPTFDIKAHPHHIISSNLTDKNPANIGFVDFSKGDVSLDVNSTAIDAGVNHSFDDFDFSGTQRDANIDIGAFEFGSTITNSNLYIGISSPNEKVVEATKHGIRVIGRLIDINNEVDIVKYYINNKKFIGQDVMPKKVEHVIGIQHLKTGINTFHMKAFLKNGASFESKPLLIKKPAYISSKSVNKSKIKEVNQLKYYYNSIDKELVINKPINMKILNVEVYDLLGKTIKVWNNFNVTNQIRKKLENISTGVYILKVKTNKGTTSRKILFDNN